MTVSYTHLDVYKRQYPYEVKAVWGKHLFIMYETPQNNERTEYKATLQSIDLVSGEVEPINLRTDVIFGTTTPKEVEIVDETSDQFLVIASVEYIDVTIPLTNAPIKMCIRDRDTGLWFT